MPIDHSLERWSRECARNVEKLKFSPPVHFIYNPLDYAWNSHREYLRKYIAGPKKVLLLGMNPGPYGMMQTGVPFGEIPAVQNWLKIDTLVKAPKKQHPKRLITGFNCTRSEVSGRRFWGWLAQRFKKPEQFFKHNAVMNYCPLAFLEESGKNLTPDRLKKEERLALFEPCDKYLKKLVQHLGIQTVIGIGKFAHDRAKQSLKDEDLNHFCLLHPSPANPAANRGFEDQANQAIEAMGVWN